MAELANDIYENHLQAESTHLQSYIAVEGITKWNVKVFLLFVNCSFNARHHRV